MADLFGRKLITSDVEEITSENVLDVVSNAESVFTQNLNAMNKLWDYYTGKQDILQRVKTVREDIMNIITENRCKEVTDFKVGYRCEGPIVYVARKPEFNDQVGILNDYMLAEERPSKDRALYFYQSVFGTAYKMALPDKDAEEGIDTDPDEAPFELYAVDPRNAFVIYSTGVGAKALAGVYRITDTENKVHYTVYTPKQVRKIVDGAVTETKVNGVGMIPIIEYPNNEARIGDFEPIISIQDAINTIDSNRIDGIEQFVQSLIILTNCDLPEGTTASTLMQSGILKVRSNGDIKADVKVLSEQLDQTQTQTLKEDMYNAILTICAMPNRSTNYASGDTGIAVMYRNGWNAAESAAQSSEVIYQHSEKEMLKVILRICTVLNKLAITQSAVEIKPTRRNHENIEQKKQVLLDMLGCEKLDPKLAFIYSNMFTDPEEAYAQSLPYIQEATEQSDSSQRSE